MTWHEVARFFADKNRRKYTNIIYWYYTGDLKKNVIQMDFADDTADMSEDELFQKHYDVLKNCVMTALLFWIILMYCQRMMLFSRN